MKKRDPNLIGVLQLRAAYPAWGISLRRLLAAEQQVAGDTHEVKAADRKSDARIVVRGTDEQDALRKMKDELAAAPTNVAIGLAFIDALDSVERNAFLGLFAGALTEWQTLSTLLGCPMIGKAECQWVDDWRDFYSVRLKMAELVYFDESKPKPALGDAPGATFTIIHCGPTDLGWSVREAYWKRWQERVDARSAEEDRIDGLTG